MELTINYAAVIVSALVSVFLGFAWYGPIFGKKWMALTGIAMPAEKPPMSAMLKPAVGSAVAAFVASFVLARLISVGEAYLGFSGVANGLATAFMAWVGFVAPAILNYTLWEGKPWALFAINAGYWLAYLAVVGAILGAW